MDNTPKSKIKIEISEKTYNMLMEMYAEFLRVKTFLPKNVVEKYGSTLSDFIDETIRQFCEISKKGSEINHKLKDILGDASNIDFSSFDGMGTEGIEGVIKNLFGKNDKKTEAPKANPKKDEEVKN